jgi:hypothetical protein
MRGTHLWKPAQCEHAQVQAYRDCGEHIQGGCKQCQAMDLTIPELLTGLGQMQLLVDHPVCLPGLARYLQPASHIIK